MALMTVTLTRNPRKTLSLNLPRLDAFVMAGFLAFLIHPAGIGFAELVRFVYPFNDEVLTQMQSLQGLITGAPSLLAVVLVLAVAPAVCEELAFRGFILSGLRHLGHKWAAILATSIFFGAAHGILQQSLTACAPTLWHWTQPAFVSKTCAPSISSGVNPSGMSENKIAASKP